MENLLLPSKIEFKECDTPNKSEVIIMPCYHGYGTTIGNALRRVLLSSLPGSAVEAFKINGVQHEFTTVDGVKEDVLDVMLNLKQLIVKTHTDENVIINLTKKGPGPVLASDFTNNSEVEIVNKDLIIANLTDKKEFNLEVTIGSGRGFRTTEEKDRENYDLGTIVVDSIYTPVKDVGYSVEYTRVGDITNYEKLTLEIETNGTISPREAVYQSTQILMDHFSIILDDSKMNSDEKVVKNIEENDDKEVIEESTEDNIEKVEKKVKKEKKVVKKIKKTDKKVK